MKSNNIIGGGLFFVAISTASVFAGNSADFPPIDPRFKEIYEEIRQEEADLFEKIKKSYPNIPENAWPKSFEIPDIVFAPLKKNYSGTPECDGLPKKHKKKLTRSEFDNLINKYAACAAERNGFDSKKMNIIYDPNDPISDTEAQKLLLNPSTFPKMILDKDRAYNLINNNDHTLEDYIISFSEELISFRHYYWCNVRGMKLLYSHYDVGDDIQRLIQKNIHIISAMQHECTLNAYLLSIAETTGVDQSSPSFKRFIKYLLKIKNIYNASSAKK